MDPPRMWKGWPSSVNWDELALRPTLLLSLHPVVGMLQEDFVSCSQNVAHRLLCLNGAHDRLDRNLQTSCFGKQGHKGAGAHLNLDTSLQPIKCWINLFTFLHNPLCAGVFLLLWGIVKGAVCSFAKNDFNEKRRVFVN